MACMIDDGTAERSNIEMGSPCENHIENKLGRSLAVAPFKFGA